MSIVVPLKTKRGLNDREHPMVRHRRVKHEKELVGWSLKGKMKPALPCVCLIVRIAPGGGGLDDDNLSGALKSVRDAIAEWLGVDDKDTGTVFYGYGQQRGPWGVRVSFAPMLTSVNVALAIKP
jgi:hypothetical protein